VATAQLDQSTTSLTVRVHSFCYFVVPVFYLAMRGIGPRLHWQRDAVLIDCAWHDGAFSGSGYVDSGILHHGEQGHAVPAHISRQLVSFGSYYAANLFFPANLTDSQKLGLPAVLFLHPYNCEYPPPIGALVAKASPTTC